MNTTNMGVFIDPKVDWAFKRIFGDKVLLINFLNSLLEGERVITDLHYMNTERVGIQKEQRKAVYDLYCQTDTGEHIIVEMQNRWQEFFKDRALFYSACSIVEQGKSGKWDFSLTPVYGIFFINFMMNTEPSEYFCKDVTLVDKYTGKVFNNKLRQIYIELPSFHKQETDCQNFFECWIYNLVYMEQMNEMAFKNRNEIFGRLEDIASQANLNQEERRLYSESWKIYNDNCNTLESAKRKAAEEARAEGAQMKNLEIARNFKLLGVSTEIIMQATGLTKEEIELL